MMTLTRLLKAVSDPSRLRIMSLLMNAGELCVCDIEAVLRCTQTKVSRHLGYLKKAGLVTDTRRGLWIIYAIAPPSTDEHREILALLETILPGQKESVVDKEHLASRYAQGCCVVTQLTRPTLNSGSPNAKRRYQAVRQGTLRKNCC